MKVTLKSITEGNIEGNIENIEPLTNVVFCSTNSIKLLRSGSHPFFFFKYAILFHWLIKALGSLEINIVLYQLYL